MIGGGVNPFAPKFGILSRSQMDAIHDATIDVLAQVGVHVYSQEAASLLMDAGARRDSEGRIKVPEHLVEWAVRTAPSNVTIFDRDGSPAMQLGRHRTYFGTGSDTPNTIDPYTRERRPAVLSDIVNFARVSDALKNISFLMCMGIAQDVPAPTAELHHFAAMVTASSKPIVFTALNVVAAARVLEMAGAVSGSEQAFQRSPFAIMYIEPVSPLGLASDDMEKLLFCADHAIPCIFISGMLRGATGPVTSAGSMALANAESLAGVLIAQLKRKGTPVISGGGIIGFDMRTMISSYGSPEFILTMAALSEMARYYGLPAWGYAGCTDSKVFDEQAAADAAQWVLVAALSGSNLVHDVGFVESGMTSSLDMLVFTDEVIAKTSHLIAGIHVDETSLATDVIADVGPGGSFLTHKHTARHHRSDWLPTLEDRQNFVNWDRGGRHTMSDRVNEKVQDILENHHAESLPENTLSALLKQLDAADRAVAGGH